jgi:SulP family sulfate permease
MYLIRRGRVRIDLDVEPGGHRLIAVFARGDFFGEMAFLDHAPRAASAAAVSATELFALSRQRFDAAAARDPELGRKLFSRISKALALRLRQADAEIRALHEA